MKKLFYIFLLVASLAASTTSCTQEVISPKEQPNPGGGTLSSNKGE